MIRPAACRIACCGASGTGKTTFARWLSEMLKLPLNPVGSRSVALEMGFASPYDVDKVGKRREFQHMLQAKKIAWELEHAHTGYITDRTVFDEMTYTLMHDVSAVDESYFNRAVDHMEQYSEVVYFPVDAFCQIGTDPQRVADLTYQKLFDAALYGLLDHWYGHSLVHEVNVQGIDARKEWAGRNLRLDPGN